MNVEIAITIMNILRDLLSNLIEIIKFLNIQRVMWLTRELIEEKLLNAEYCSVEDFREICKDQKWSVKSYRKILEGILASFGIENDRRKNSINALVGFLNKKAEEKRGAEIGPKKRKRMKTSMVISVEMLSRCFEDKYCCANLPFISFLFF